MTILQIHCLYCRYIVYTADTFSYCRCIVHNAVSLSILKSRCLYYGYNVLTAENLTILQTHYPYRRDDIILYAYTLHIVHCPAETLPVLLTHCHNRTDCIVLTVPVSRDFWHFFHEWNPFGHLINMLKWFLLKGQCHDIFWHFFIS